MRDAKRIALGDRWGGCRGASLQGVASGLRATQATAYPVAASSASALSHNARTVPVRCGRVVSG
ncbi:hypothetical protein XOC_3134 [Xanthomonas oryzae pv. oryzicola BLS256]|uniref:Uncharacterized protein n=1 Tax=Xanthomonas oryzae pv. oryzicola (strain BLS256) TaxID=383407 RepID=G7TA47_XANOB|nr:hypothetical protein XOC_3134 [Xanthomonas oryzae pv. oryzicola BLS256]